MRYSKFVRICCFALAFLFAVSLVSCFGGNDDNGPDYDDPTRNPFGRYENTVKITGVMEYQVHNDSRVPQNITPDNQAYIRLIKERLNIEFSYLWKVPPTQYSEKLSLSMLANELPDIFKVTASDYASLKKAGMLKNLATAYEYASEDVKTFLNRDPDVIRRLTDSDGGIYAVPQYSDNRRGVPVMYIRQDWLDASGGSDHARRAVYGSESVQREKRCDLRACHEQQGLRLLLLDQRLYEYVRLEPVFLAARLRRAAARRRDFGKQQDGSEVAEPSV